MDYTSIGRMDIQFACVSRLPVSLMIREHGCPAWIHTRHHGCPVCRRRTSKLSLISVYQGDFSSMNVCSLLAPQAMRNASYANHGCISNFRYEHTRESHDLTGGLTLADDIGRLRRRSNTLMLGERMQSEIDR